MSRRTSKISIVLPSLNSRVRRTQSRSNKVWRDWGWMTDISKWNTRELTPEKIRTGKVTTSIKEDKSHQLSSGEILLQQKPNKRMKTLRKKRRWRKKDTKVLTSTNPKTTRRRAKKRRKKSIERSKNTADGTGVETVRKFPQAHRTPSFFQVKQAGKLTRGRSLCKRSRTGELTAVTHPKREDTKRRKTEWFAPLIKKFINWPLISWL